MPHGHSNTLLSFQRLICTLILIEPINDCRKFVVYIFTINYASVHKLYSLVIYLIVLIIIDSIILPTQYQDKCCRTINSDPYFTISL